MTLFAAEMRKIWRPIPVLMLMAMGALWAFVGIMPAYQAFTETERSVGFLPLNLTSERRLVTRYGPLTDQSTIDRMKADIPRLEQQATRDIQAHPAEAKTLGITDFAGYKHWYNAIADQTFYPTDAPNTIPEGRTATGADTAESAAIREARKKTDPTATMTEAEQAAMYEAERTLSNGSEALQDLHNIALLMQHFPITQSDAQRNLDNSVAMLRSTAHTDHPVTPLQQQFERDYRTAAANGWDDTVSGGCVATDVTGKTVTNETGGEENAPMDGADATDTTGSSGSTGDAQLGEGCDSADASLGSSSYRVPGTMPSSVTDRLARYAAHPGQSSYIAYNIVENTWAYAFAIAVFMVIASAALTIPVMVRDRGRRMTQLQWASRSGRSGRRVRVVAVAASSLLVSVLTLTAFGLPLAVLLRDFLGTPVLNLNTNVSMGGVSFEMPFGVPIVPWAYWTLGQYLAIIGATIVVLALATTMAGAWLCRSTGSIIRMLLIMVPLLALVLLPAQFVYFQNMFLMGNWLTNRLTMPGLEFWMPLAALTLAVAAWVVSTIRLRRRELLR
ncbi:MULTISPECIES: hypothetical protein [Bifidobacterium]|uniref:ABC transporter permease n=1 Tax=Bifidobacterium reuteri DSM 23975 TaxID=1437610 RepID=A0A087CM69_9BIFI|nr:MULTISPECIES: hypothetical protein [Bifidobacterium]KFI84369.1 hypothetical protein BREU_1135 [Bifidobacterium reuteri DSM 23975]TPF77776.1 hypothetical protein BW09_08050 [Bifidobacterium sp. UTCIF-1]TPF80263.1 hypothetical protein BW08_05755 [Bifidobacterium sp. UTCIF-24]TPF82948.1 hypothetical protein BW12_01860 [Bifidobacterium sp. UTCIF-3]TPF84179.1 hypothetical protein BW07_05870 [Bifidobacterium sp. UTCIF-36]